jgi:predicted restriction endonuclease
VACGFAEEPVPPLHRVVAHHITYWEHHGDTSISNMVLLCAKHHHMVHEGRWRIQRNEQLDPGHPDYLTLAAPARRP